MEQEHQVNHLGQREVLNRGVWVDFISAKVGFRGVIVLMGSDVISKHLGTFLLDIILILIAGIYFLDRKKRIHDFFSMKVVLLSFARIVPQGAYEGQL